MGSAPWSDDVVTDIKRLVLDVLKPHKPTIIEMSKRLSALKGVEGVSCSLDEVDQDTESVQITIEGGAVNYESVEDTLRELGAVIHSVDQVASGKRLVDDVHVMPNRK
ncbi:MAG: DUF211 domain-containing protein [Methanobacteriota archaeon]